jgi:hypothetical protein
MRRLPKCRRDGCPNRVKLRRCTWCSQACVPREVRAENCRKSRATYAYRIRRQQFAEELARLTDRRVTREDLLATFQAVYQRAYNSGFQAASRQRRQPAQAA